MYTIARPTLLEGDGFTGVTLVDVVPDWAHGPSHDVIGPLTQDADARARAWETNPDNIPQTGTLCPHTPPGTPPGAGSGGTNRGPGEDADGATDGGTDGGTGGRIGELVAGLAGALVGGVVDGILEDPVQDYLGQLEAVRNGEMITGPPLPAAQGMISVPVLGLLGVTNEPAQLGGQGPIPEETARKLLERRGVPARAHRPRHQRARERAGPGTVPAA